LLNKK